MRIALVSREYPPESAKGGIGTQTYLKAHSLAAHGHDVFVISESPNGEASEISDAGVRVMRLANVHHKFEIHNEPVDWIARSVEVAACLETLHGRTPLDLIDFPEWGGEGYVYLLNRCDWKRQPRTLVHIHGPLIMFANETGWPERNGDFFRTGAAMEEACLRLADSVISSSRYSAEICRSYYNLDREIPVLHVGVDISVFFPKEIPKESSPTVIFAGKFSRAKGVLDLVRAAVQVAARFPNLKLRMIGRGDDVVIAEMKAIAADRPGLLEITGFMSHGELAAEFSKAHVFASPSPCEGGPGFVFLEAMACGLPAIACADTGAAEVVSEETGILVPRGDSVVLGESIGHLLADPESRQHKGACARQFVISHADSRICLERIERHYHSVVEANMDRSRVNKSPCQP